jgi:SnoaL-like domain
MPDRDPRAVINQVVDLSNHRAWDRLGEVYHPDYIEDYPQSGERIRGLAHKRAVLEQYPGGLASDSLEEREVVGAEDRWVVTPAYTVVRITGTGDRYTVVFRVRYPDGSHWFAVQLVEFRAGLIAHATAYFAPEFAAPDWRAPFREAIPAP